MSLCVIAMVGLLAVRSDGAEGAKNPPALWDGLSLAEVCSAYGLGQAPQFPRKEIRTTAFDDADGSWKHKSIRREYALHGGLLVFTTEVVERRKFAPTKEVVAECAVDLRFAAENGVARRSLDGGPVARFLDRHGVSVGFGPTVAVRWRQLSKDSRQEIFELPGSAYVIVEPAAGAHAVRAIIRPLIQVSKGTPTPPGTPADPPGPPSESSPERPAR